MIPLLFSLGTVLIVMSATATLPEPPEVEETLSDSKALQEPVKKKTKKDTAKTKNNEGDGKNKASETISWQDNPNDCDLDTHWVAEEDPFYCIEKPKPVKTTPKTKSRNVASQKKPEGSCKDWMRQAGVTDMDNAYELIMRESSCNPNARNPSSDACGIAQALPCSKKPGQWNDPVNSMRWMQKYVMGRYGSWSAAVQFHDRNNWY